MRVRGRRDAAVEGAARDYAGTLGQALLARLPALKVLRPGRYVIALLAGGLFTLVAMYAFNAYWTATLAAGIAFAVTFLSFSISCFCASERGAASTSAEMLSPKSRASAKRASALR